MNTCLRRLAVLGLSALLAGCGDDVVGPTATDRPAGAPQASAEGAPGTLHVRAAGMVKKLGIT